MNLKKIRTYLFDVAFVLSSLFFLKFVREKSKFYLQSLQGQSVSLANVQEMLSGATLETYNVTQVDLTLKMVEVLIKKALLLNLIALPVVIFLLWIFFEGFNWKELNGLKPIKFTLYTLPVFVFFYISIYAFFNYVSGFVYFSISYAWVWFLLSLVLLLVVSYFSFLLCAKKDFKFGINHFNKLILPLGSFFALTFITLIVLALIYLFFVMGYSLILPILIALILIFFMNKQREILLKYLKKLS